MSATNRGSQRHKDDYYATPPWCVKSLLPVLGSNPNRTVLEPCAGTGSISHTLLNEGFVAPSHLTQVELDVDRAKLCPQPCEVGDFLNLDIDKFRGVDVVITNPPYALAQEFIDVCLTLETEVIMLLRLNFLGSQKRAQWHRNNPSDVYVLPKRPSFTGGGTDATEYAWFVWGPGRGNYYTVLEICDV